MNYRMLSIVFSLILSIFVVTNAQAAQKKPEKKEPKTKLELFERQTGNVLVKGYSEIGTIRGMGKVSVDCIELKNMTTGKRQLGIVIDVEEGGRFERSNRSFIDYDEIDSLIKGIGYISKANKKITSLNKFEATYKTKGDFRVVTFNSANSIEAAVRSGYIGSSTAYISLDKLTILRGLVAEAKKRLDAIK